jgi:hypothetical protein
VDPISAILNCDFEAAECLRGNLTPYEVSAIIAIYQETMDWNQKDIAIHLLQDCDPTTVENVMRDALHSPTTASRAIAVCALKDDFTLFDRFLRGGFVDASLVDAVIKTEFRT